MKIGLKQPTPSYKDKVSRATQLRVETTDTQYGSQRRSCQRSTRRARAKSAQSAAKSRASMRRQTTHRADALCDVYVRGHAVARPPLAVLKISGLSVKYFTSRYVIASTVSNNLTGNS